MEPVLNEIQIQKPISETIVNLLVLIILVVVVWAGSSWTIAHAANQPRTTQTIKKLDRECTGSLFGGDCTYLAYDGKVARSLTRDQYYAFEIGQQICVRPKSFLVAELIKSGACQETPAKKP